MALATTCPSCKTSFKVNPEQLKLRKGLVRCGKCQHVFSGIQYLRYISESRKPRPARKRKTTNEVAPETVAEDLNTAFFLPDTRFEPETVEAVTATREKVDTVNKSAGAGRNQTQPARKTDDKTKTGAETRVTAQAQSSATVAGPDVAFADTVSPDTVSPDTVSPDSLSPDTVSPDTVSATGDDKSGSSRRSRKSRRNRRKNRRRNKNADAYNASSDVKPEATAIATAAAVAVATSASRHADSTPNKADAPPEKNPSATSMRQAASTDETAESNSLSNEAVTGDDNQTASGAATESTTARDASVDTEPAKVRKPKATPEAAPDQSKARPGDKKTDAAGKEDEHWLDGIGDSDTDEEQAIIDDEEEDAIDFFGQTSRPVFDFDLPPRSVWIAAGALALLLTMQLAIGARDSLAAWFPSAKPVLESVSTRLGLQVQLPMKPDAIRIESHDLANAPASDGPGAYVLNLLIRNHADLALRWPAIELTLTDRTGANILVRKALLPGDYLVDKQRAATGMPARSEQAVRLNLRTENIGPMHGYTAVLFYP